MRLQRKAEGVFGEIFLGGPVELFEVAGRLQLILLLRYGVEPGSKVLDVGCGCLRAGYWLIHFLSSGCYFGIEPNEKMLETGIREFLEPGVLEAKQPRFANNADFDFSVFGEKFDFFLARSIWTHAPKPQIETMLDGFVLHGREHAVLFTSYLRAASRRQDYQGDAWVGLSHESTVAGMVHHDFAWIERACHARGLVVQESRDEAYNFGGQTWLRVARR